MALAFVSKFLDLVYERPVAGLSLLIFGFYALRRILHSLRVQRLLVAVST